MNTLFIIATLFTGSYGVGINTCNYNDENTCLDNWPCAWCNKSTVTNITGCYKIPICGLNDEIYNQLIYEGEQPNSIATYFHNTIITNGVSKSGAVAGLRVGWLIAKNELLVNLKGSIIYLTGLIIISVSKLLITTCAVDDPS